MMTEWADGDSPWIGFRAGVDGIFSRQSRLAPEYQGAGRVTSGCSAMNPTGLDFILRSRIESPAANHPAQRFSLN